LSANLLPVFKPLYESFSAGHKKLPAASEKENDNKLND